MSKTIDYEWSVSYSLDGDVWFENGFQSPSNARTFVENLVASNHENDSFFYYVERKMLVNIYDFLSCDDVNQCDLVFRGRSISIREEQ